jgi:aspartate dehydrogenase
VLNKKILKFAIIGQGAIAATLLEQIDRANMPTQSKPVCIGFVNREANSLANIIKQQPDLIVEAAGHQALRIYGPQILEAGIDLLLASVGALANEPLELALKQKAEASGAAVLIPAGALGGLDALRSARWAGIDTVCYTSEKSPKAWRGTAAESMLDLASVTTKQVFFNGTARQAALQFPQNANVAAAVALAGIGFDQTQVQLCADPDAAFNRHRVFAEGAFGNINVVIEGRVLLSNPKTSMLAPMSLVDALMNRHATLRVL